LTDSISDLCERMAVAMRVTDYWPLHFNIYIRYATAVIAALGLRECDDEDCRCRHDYVIGG